MKKKNILLIVILTICLGGVIYAGTSLLRSLHMYREGKDTYVQIAEEVRTRPTRAVPAGPSAPSSPSVPGSAPEGTEEAPSEEWVEVEVADPAGGTYAITVPADPDAHHILREPVLNGYRLSELLIAHYDVDFDALRAVNPDVVAWITIPGTVIDYPVVQGRDNEEYLTKTVDGKFNANGSIFLDARCEELFAYNTIFYGHNMRSRYMFHPLADYVADEAFLKAHPYIHIITPEETRVYCVYSVHQTEHVSFVFAEVSSLSQYIEYQDLSVAASVWNCGIPMGPSQDIITLSTCANDEGDHRLILHAVCVETRPR